MKNTVFSLIANTQMPTIISADKSESIRQTIHKIWQYREMMWMLAWRDLKAQYAQTFLGLFSAALKPLIGLLVFTLFFDKMVQVDTGDIPYPLFAFSGMLAWYYFTYLIAHAGTALVNNQHLIKKIAFPKIILPFTSVLVGFAEFGLSLVLLLLMMLFLGHFPTLQIFWLPLFILLTAITGLSIGIWLSALTVRYRDFNQIIPYIVNLGIWLTPVFYPTTLLPQQYSFLMYLNPMAGLIAGFRWCILGDVIPSAYYAISFIPVVFLFILGLKYFVTVDKHIADLV